jgi:hypothetical protein
VSMCVIVPSRGRPANALRLHKALHDVDHVFAVDATDPTFPGYTMQLPALVTFDGHPTMIEKLNRCASSLVDEYPYLGFMGDDHLPRTEGWAWAVASALEESPIVYCDDGHQGENLPTAVFMRSELVRRLGWMALPTVEHLYCDNAWLDLGKALGCTYLPDVLIEHLHPHAGKAENDPQYDRVNSMERFEADRAAWEQWRAEQLPLDVARAQA